MLLHGVFEFLQSEVNFILVFGHHLLDGVLVLRQLLHHLLILFPRLCQVFLHCCDPTFKLSALAILLIQELLLRALQHLFNFFFELTDLALGTLLSLR